MRRLLLLSLLCLPACGLVGHPLGFDFDALSSGMTEADTLSRHHGVTWKCRATLAPYRDLGQEECDAQQVALGETKATDIVYFFRDGKLTAANIEYATESFEVIAKALDGKYKRADYGQTAPRVVWAVKDGIVASTSKPRPNGRFFVQWYSSAEAEKFER
jgi:hypothetical protein